MPARSKDAFSFRTLLILLASIALTPLSSSAQSDFNALGSDAPLIESLPGDQVHPALAIDADGGFIVWQDSLGDGSGFGIRAQRLDAALLPEFSAFTVNAGTEGDQENPKAALFPGGEAVFVWQSRVGGQRDVYARFMNPDGTFATDDVRVNDFVADDQKDAALAVLADGNLVVVWASMGRDGSMLGVYGQLFAANGARLGGSFPVNLTTQYNQHSPSVTALRSGGFAVVWINENVPLVSGVTEAEGAGTFAQGVENRIHVYARLFGAQASPMSGEFRVGQTAAVASRPAAAGLDNGGFSIAWTQRHISDSAKSYDVFMRRYNAAGAPLADEARVHEQDNAPQYDVRLESLGDDQLAVWTSYGQDGSAEGVFGRFISGTGQFLSGDIQFNTAQTLSKQIHPAVASDGMGRMLAVWTSFNAGSSFDIRVKRYDAVREMPVPGAPFVNALDGGSIAVSWPSLHGYPEVEYRVYINGAATPALTADSNRGVVSGLQPGTQYSFRLQYRLADGRVSSLSVATLGRTWGVDAGADGLPDDWQAEHWGANPAKWPTDVNVDSDGDGATDMQEFLAGTDPMDAASALKTGLQMNGAQIRLQWNARPGQSYIIEVSTDLQTWNAVGRQFASDGSASININNFNAAAFYRVVLQR